MKYVLDASVAVKWVLTEPDSPKAVALRDEFRKHLHELLAADAFLSEVAHSLTRAERKGILKQGEAAGLIADILSTPPDLHPVRPLLARAVEISSQMRVGYYDCLYVALAEREKCELITADDKLVTNLRASFPFVESLASLP
jgi:predicted nucleic acid-binding protein